MESASKVIGKPLFRLISEQSEYRFPIPLGNILGGGAHAGPGTPDIQEILISAIGAKRLEMPYKQTWLCIKNYVK